MTGSVGTQGQVVIDEAIRDALGVTVGWIAVQRLVDDHVEIRFLPPGHGESLKGSLASRTTVTVSGDEWHEAREAEVRKLVAEGKKEAMSAIRHVARNVAPKEPRAKSRPKVISDLANIVASDQAKTLRDDCEHFAGVVDSIEGMDTPGQEQRALLEKRTKALQKSMDRFMEVLFAVA